MFNARSVRAPFETAVRAAGIDDFVFHSCRHHFASWFMMRGGQLLALKEILGHASLAMTTRYSHLAPDHLRGEMVKTDRGRTRSTQSSKIEPDRVANPREPSVSVAREVG